MIRESDEECLKLIATIRARKGETEGLCLRSETERLLGNLEARIEGSHAHAPGENCPCGTERCREAWRELRQAATHEPHTHHVAVGDRVEFVAGSGEESAIRFRDIIREEVRKEVEQELAPVCESITEVQQNIFKASAEIGEARRVADGACRQHVREEVAEATKGLPRIVHETTVKEVAAEVERQLGEWQEAKASPAIRTWVDNLEHEVKKLRAALEARGS